MDTATGEDLGIMAVVLPLEHGSLALVVEDTRVAPATVTVEELATAEAPMDRVAAQSTQSQMAT